MYNSPFLLTLALLTSTLARAPSRALTLENDVLSVVLSTDTAAMSVTDKRTGLHWQQAARPGFSVTEKAVATPTTITAQVLGPHERVYDIVISLGGAEARNAIDVSLSIPGKRYTYLPDYPFPFSPAGNGWQYVQNTTGEGMLMPLSNPDAIHKAFGWNGSQPWWGITDLKQAMMARLDSFRLPDASPDPKDTSAYALPLKICYSFYTDGGYVGLAKAYRQYFLKQHPEMQTQEQKVAKRPGIAYLKDAAYIYFWDDWSVTVQLIPEIKKAGIDKAIANFYIANNQNRVDPKLFAEIEKEGWLGGLYRMPAPNLFQLCSIKNWTKRVLVGDISEKDVLEAGGRGGRKAQWDRICASFLAERWLEKARSLTGEYHNKLYYLDTLTSQLAPCVDPAHPTTVEENLEARKEIMRGTQELGLVVGSGEGVTPTWSIPVLDFFEGAMSLRTYKDILPDNIADGGFGRDFHDLPTKEAEILVDETKRIPLLALGFHDYVAESWVWRDTTFRDPSLAWKKDLTNILHGAMPIWHMNREFWDKHKEEFLQSYQKTHAVREKIGFAEMTDHGWLTPDKKVQYTDWNNGYRVIVNFGDRPFERRPKEPLPPRSFAIEKGEQK